MHYFIIRSCDYLSQTITRFKQSFDCVDGFSVTNIKYSQIFPQHLLQNQAFIFTSQYSLKALGQFFVPKNHRAFCIGNHTAKQAALSGFKHIEIAHPSHAEALCSLIQQKNNDNSLVYCTGKHRKPYLEHYLNSSHIKFSTLELYDAVAIDSLPINILEKLQKISLTTMICFSIRNAVICYDLLQKANDIDIKQYHWHIVGHEKDAHILFQNVLFYKTPHDLYRAFDV
ncbi:MAG: uroporphyrinogen-III synthase [Alphaproteobacteria bacterium]